MSLVEVLVLFLSSAAVAAVVSGLFSLKTTRSLIAGQRQERREAAAERDREREEEAKRTDTAMFWARYVENGLEPEQDRGGGGSREADRWARPLLVLLGERERAELAHRAPKPECPARPGVSFDR
jgi:hypothetical protein